MNTNQVAVFNGPSVKSDVTGNLKSADAKGGVHCILSEAPVEPQSSAVLKNGQWEEVSNSSSTPNAGSSFILDLDGEDGAVSKLLTSLRGKKTIDELAVYELNNTSNEVQFGYYFHKIFVNSASSAIGGDGKKVIRLACSCISFKQRDRRDNSEPVIWDWDTNDHKYTGSMK